MSNDQTKTGSGFNFSRFKNTLIGRTYDTFLRIVVFFLKIPKPTLFVGENSSLKLCDAIANAKLKNVLVITDQVLFDLGVLNRILESLKTSGVETQLYTGVKPDPTWDLCETAFAMYREKGCDSVLVVGGGSSIDTGKVVALAANNAMSFKDMVGFFKSKNVCAPFFVVPTTAGTGSEASLAAVVTDPVTHNKDIIADVNFIPRMTALDPVLMQGMPKSITAATGVDALTHCVEAYISHMTTEESDFFASSGISMVFENLLTSYNEGTNLKAREQMALASHYGALAFSNTTLGYCHAFSHRFTELYGLPHGVANAKALPHILAFNLRACEKEIAEMGRVIGLTGSDSECAQGFVDATKKLIADVGISPHIDDLKESDFDFIIQTSFKEVNTSFTVPVYMSYDDGRQFLESLQSTS